MAISRVPIYALLLLLLVFSATAEEATGDVAEESAVLTLDSSNFNEVISKHPFIVVEFYAPWCGHCQRLAPEYEKAASILASSDPPVVLAKVDANEEKNRELASKYDVSGFPTLKIIKNQGASVQEYKGPREAEGIVEYLKKQVGPASIEIKTADEAAKLTEGKKVFIVGIFPEYSGNEYDTFMSVAEKLRSDYDFVHTLDAKLLPRGDTTTKGSLYFGLKEDQVPLIVLQQHDGDKYLNPNFEPDQILLWLKGYKEGKLKAYKKSEAIPEVNDEPVKVVVADNIHDLVSTISYIFAMIISLLAIRVSYVLYWPGRPLKSSPTISRHTLIVLGSGGHTAEMLSIVNVLRKDKFAPRSYVAALTDNMSLEKAQAYEECLLNYESNKEIKRGGAQFKQIYRSREVGQSYITSIGTTIVAILHALWIVLKLRPQVLLGWRWCSIIYIESIARVKKLSLSGLLLYKLRLADKFFVQWPLLQQKYPRSQYAGRVM